MTLTHLEPEEFVKEAFIHHARLEVQPIVLDNGTAGMVYLFHTADGSVCFNDRLYTSQNIIMNESIHAEVYRKTALMNPSLHA